MKTFYRLVVSAITLLGSSHLFASNHYYDSTSIEVLAGDNVPARACYQSASIAARIHYTSRRDLENCNNALTRTALSMRDRAATLANRGIIYMSLEEYDLAIKDYQDAIGMKPEMGELNVNIGNVYYLGKVYDKAVAEYTAAIEKKSSKIYVAYFNRGMAYESLGKLAEAEADIKVALEMLPQWAAAQKKLEEVQQKIHNPAPANTRPANS
jgi:tetratricopeptide (TPR) repeat protein